MSDTNSSKLLQWNFQNDPYREVREICSSVISLTNLLTFGTVGRVLQFSILIGSANSCRTSLLPVEQSDSLLLAQGTCWNSLTISILNGRRLFSLPRVSFQFGASSVQIGMTWWIILQGTSLIFIPLNSTVYQLLKAGMLEILMTFRPELARVRVKFPGYFGFKSNWVDLY